VKELRRLLGFLRPFAGLTLLAVLAGFATVAAGVGLLGTSAYLIARAAQMPSIAELQVAIVGVRFFGISRGIFRYLERLTGHSVNLRLQARLREWFFAQVEPLAPAQLQDERGGDLLARVVVDIETLENLYVRLFGPALVALATTTAACVLVGFWHALGGTLAGIPCPEQRRSQTGGAAQCPERTSAGGHSGHDRPDRHERTTAMVGPGAG
jgi:ATP-binding cassette subfamily C protein CydC